MDFIHRLPFVLGAIMAIIVGIISSSYDAGQQNTYLRMAISMVVFFAIGVYIKNTILSIHEEIEKKKEEEHLRKMQEYEAHEQQKAPVKNEMQTEEFEEEESEEKSDVEDYGEDFSPLTVSEIINTRSEE